MSVYEELLDELVKKYIDEGMSEFDARMKAVMSQEALDMVYPGLKKDEDNENK
tara:strand:- start:428 stop:586 length:159 start_codon:yes stop_codon:yes gene_type:complete